jgi:hypothetical protein
MRVLGVQDAKIVAAEVVPIHLRKSLLCRDEIPPSAGESPSLDGFISSLYNLTSLLIADQ